MNADPARAPGTLRLSGGIVLRLPIGDCSAAFSVSPCRCADGPRKSSLAMGLPIREPLSAGGDETSFLVTPSQTRGPASCQRPHNVRCVHPVVSSIRAFPGGQDRPPAGRSRRRSFTRWPDMYRVLKHGSGGCRGPDGAPLAQASGCRFGFRQIPWLLLRTDRRSHRNLLQLANGRAAERGRHR
jgi:hypothetical protein